MDQLSRIGRVGYQHPIQHVRLLGRRYSGMLANTRHSRIRLIDIKFFGIVIFTQPAKLLFLLFLKRNASALPPRKLHQPLVSWRAATVFRRTGTCSIDHRRIEPFGTRSANVVFTIHARLDFIFSVPDQSTIGILQLGITEFNAWRQKNPEKLIDLSEADLAGSDLAGIDFSHVDLSGADLSESNLCGANFTGSNLDGANVSNTLLRGASFSHSSLVEANLSHADAEEVVMEAADLTGANLSYANLKRAQAAQSTLIEANGLEVSFLEADLNRADLSQANFSAANFDRANLLGGRLSVADLSRASFSGAEMGEITADEASFQEAKLTQASLKRAKLAGARFDGAQLEETNLSRADLYRTVFNQAKLRGADLKHSKLAEASFKDASLAQAILSHVDFNRVNIDGTDFEGANLRGAKGLLFSSSHIHRARTDQHTWAGWFVLRESYSQLKLAIYGAILLLWFGPALLKLSRMATQPPIPDSPSTSLWGTLLGTENGLLSGSVSVTLMLYYLARLWITIHIQELREREEVTGVTPRLSAYRNYLAMHFQLMRFLTALLMVVLMGFVLAQLF